MGRYRYGASPYKIRRTGSRAYPRFRRRRSYGGRRFRRRRGLLRLPPAVSTFGSSKFVDGPVGAENVVISPIDTANFVLLNGVQEGTAKYNRIGDRIRMKSIQIFAKWTPNTGAVLTEERVYGRVAIVYDRRPGPTDPPKTAIWNTYAQDGSQRPNPWSPPNPNNSDRFIVIRDCKFYFSTNNRSSTNFMALFLMNNTFVEGSECNLFKKLNGLETQYTSNANPVAIGNIGTRALYLIIYSSNANLADAPGAFEFSWFTTH